MKITPLEIRQKVFNKNFRGYDKDEVNAFLQSLSSEWEKLLNEHKEALKKNDELEKEVAKLKEVENSLFKTLKTAEDTGANMVEQSKRAADLHLKEAKMQVDSMLNEANAKARNIIEEAEDLASNTFQNLVEELKDLEEDARAIENLKENFFSELRSGAKDILERLEKFESKMLSGKDVMDKIKVTRKEFKGKKPEYDKVVPETTKQEPKKPENTLKGEEKKEEQKTTEPEVQITDVSDEKEDLKKKDENDGSFFDSID